MPKQWPQPRILFIAAGAMFGLGMILLYAGFFRIAPVALLATVLLCIFATVALTDHDIQRNTTMEKQNDQ